ncbi:unnamed protein product [Pleuronectes platessa]|uniref:Uncharacterized protein n=1 Tax=Pleuronectes platessa TaxID=8262 RepID=A0A9N7U3X1_PLEPL|nr:unnamed protein product [Pleuronectes platessa]
MPAAGELRCVDAAIESVLEDIDSAFILKEEHRTRSLHGFVPVTPEAEAPRCAKAASRCFSLRCNRHKVLTWEWMGASCYLRLGAALKCPFMSLPSLDEDERGRAGGLGLQGRHIDAIMIAFNQTHDQMEGFLLGRQKHGVSI